MEKLRTIVIEIESAIKLFGDDVVYEFNLN